MKTEIDTILDSAVAGGLPGVVALATDRDGIIFQGAAGVRRLGTDCAMSPESVLAIFSTTKAITATIALTLVDEGRLDLDAPARDYVPAVGELEVLEKLNEDGTIETRPPRRDITTRHFLTHTAGLAYEVFNDTYCKLADSGHVGNVLEARREFLMTPLLFDPGLRWEYGTNIDWTGHIIETIVGKRLGEVMAERIFAPLGMESTAFSLTDDMRSRLASIHVRDADGQITATDIQLPPEPEMHMGGHGLYGSLTDYIRFIRMWLNDGAAPDGHRVLLPDTVRMAARNQIGKSEIPPLGVGRAHLTNPADLAPDTDTGWGLSFLINTSAMPTGRCAGSLAWAGLANLYFWIDRSRGVGGIWGTQLFPFADPDSLASFRLFESAVYRNL